MRNKIRKLFVVMLFIIIVFSFSSVAFARETVTYSGTCANNFYASNTLTKINDTHLQNHTINVRIYNTEMGSLCNSKMYIAGNLRSSKYNMGPQSYHDFKDLAKQYTGTCRLQILNTSSNINHGYSIRATGEFTIGTSFIYQ